MGRGNISIVSNNKSHRYTKKSQIILEGQGLQGAIDDGLFFFYLNYVRYAKRTWKPSVKTLRSPLRHF